MTTSDLDELQDRTSSLERTQRRLDGNREVTLDKIKGFQLTTETRFRDMEEHFDRLNRCLESLEDRLDGRMDRIDKHIDGLGKRTDGFVTRFDALAASAERFDRKIDAVTQEIIRAVAEMLRKD
jgi:hypothetical protein